jgi:hypothetical protein
MHPLCLPMCLPLPLLPCVSMDALDLGRRQRDAPGHGELHRGLCEARAQGWGRCALLLPQRAASSPSSPCLFFSAYLISLYTITILFTVNFEDRYGTHDLGANATRLVTGNCTAGYARRGGPWQGRRAVMHSMQRRRIRRPLAQCVGL